MPDLAVVIRDHSGNETVRFENPAELSWTYQIGAKGAGKVEFAIAEFDTSMGNDIVRPKIDDFTLELNGFPLMAGVIQSVNFPLGQDIVRVMGEDWMCWLDQPLRAYYPGLQVAWDHDRGITDVIADNDPTQFFLNFSSPATVGDWVDAILEPLSQEPSEQIILTALKQGTAFDLELVGHIARGSGRTVLSILAELAQMGTPYGFDFWVAPNKELNLVGPRKTDPLSVFPVAGFYESSGTFLGDTFDESPIVDGEWTNNGPLGTDILFEDGIGNVRRYFRKTHDDSIAQFRRWGADVEIGTTSPGLTVGTMSETEFKAAASQYRMLFPQKELTLQVKPELFTWDSMLLEPVDVDWRKFTGSYHRIDAEFWITSQTYRPIEEGSSDYVCDLTLDQIYIPIS